MASRFKPFFPTLTYSDDILRTDVQVQKLIDPSKEGDVSHPLPKTLFSKLPIGAPKSKMQDVDSLTCINNKWIRNLLPGLSTSCNVQWSVKYSSLRRSISTTSCFVLACVSWSRQAKSSPEGEILVVPRA